MVVKDDGALLIIQTKSTRPAIAAIHPDDIPAGDMVFVPESNIEFSAGNGRTAHYELIEDQEPATYRLSWFQKYGINPDRVRRFRVAGDSMEPLLYARDTILVSMEETNIIDGKLYAIRYGDELRVKYLSRRLDGTITLRSVNPAYKDEEVPPDLAMEHISVIGRVRDRSGTGGL
jgi:phage repressor protein C with HTH and peptisase S24 domain